MSGIENYIGFVVTGIILNITPGADTIYIITRSISEGRKAGFYSVLGIITGALCHTLLTAFGLSIILTKSIIAFTIIKWIGAAYLIFLGIQYFLNKEKLQFNTSEQRESVNYKKVFKQGFLTNLLNPKVAFFYLSLLPQFINPHNSNSPIPFILLGLTFITTGTIWCLFLVYSASTISRTLRKNDTIKLYLQKITGLIFIGLGIKLLLSKLN
jgi:RhtB (resistance to homoserine/threonine) family protein